MPVEVLAQRGEGTLRFGPMKPVGLVDPRTGHRAWALLQLRKENAAGTMYNLVGFQTNLKFPEQKRVFSLIPALHRAEFVRYGVMHRQITGVEGYMESAASGILAGINAARRLADKPTLTLPDDTMIGALSRYIADPSVKKFQPMGANFGVLPELRDRPRDKRERAAAYAARALASLDKFLQENNMGDNYENHC